MRIRIVINGLSPIEGIILKLIIDGRRLVTLWVLDASRRCRVPGEHRFVPSRVDLTCMKSSDGKIA
jgi:hypothetical protein